MAFEYAVVLTGGIATGKSSVVQFFLEKGINVIDADKVAHEILEKHAKEIVNLFGSACLVDGKLNRKALGKIIFNDKKEKKKLEDFLHPLIFDAIEKQSTILDKNKECYIIDIPLFFETKRYPITKSIVVYTPKELQLERLMKRDNSNKEEAQLRIDSQIPIEDKKELATYIIDNSGDLEALYKIFMRLFMIIC